MLIYTIIVTYNAMKWVDWCLQSLRDSSVPSIPIVIDNDSKDNTVQYIKENYPKTILFPQNKNLGFGQANNLGIRYALEHNADYVLLLNQDAAMHPLALEYLLAQTDGTSLLSPLHLNGNGTKIDYIVKVGSVYGSNNTLVDDWALNTLKPSYEMGEIPAACWLLPMTVIKKVGGFNPLFFHYGEDNNYYRRLIYHNIKILLVPRAYMYHDREVHGNMQVYNKKLVYRQLLIIATNINLSRGQRAREYGKVLVQCYMALLSPQGHYTIGQYLYAILQVLLKKTIIQQSRKQEQQINATWL